MNEYSAKTPDESGNYNNARCELTRLRNPEKGCGTRRVTTALDWLRHTGCAYCFGYGIRSMPTTLVTAYGVCLLLWLRHTEYAYYFTCSRLES